MSIIANSAGYREYCKWCSLYEATIIFEKANLCAACYRKATWAVENPQLCLSCKSLFTDEKVMSYIYSKRGVTYGLNTVEKGAEQGCGLCRMMLLQDPNPDPGRVIHGLSLFAGASRVEAPYWETGFSSHEDVDSLYFSTEHDQFSLTLSVSARTDDPAAKFVSQRPVEGTLANESIKEQIRTWLKECLETHQDCQKRKLKPFMPTRVIDVASSRDCVKLVHPSSADAQYVAMSYCWGIQPFLTTTQANFKQHTDNIDISSMPQTFQDAVTTTRDLGCRYLWIDALCIIQDSSDDKAKEIGMMGDIYTNATITIASVSGTCVADGFLQTRPRLTVQLPYRCPNGETGQIEVSPQITVDIWQEPLYTRGWCLQENLLSTRILLYTGTEVVWQCQSVPLRRPNTTHVSYERDDPSLGASAFRRLPTRILSPGQSMIELDSATESERYRIWINLVANYTRRRLTVAADRLPALAGVAQTFEASWSDEYFYGIWKRQFIPSLGWHRDDRVTGQGQYPQLQTYRAPSWSWASIDGPVAFESEFEVRNSKTQGAVLVDVVEELVSNDRQIYLKAKLEASLIPVADFLQSMSKEGHTLVMDDHDHRKDEWPWPRYGDRFDDLDEEMIKITWLMLLREGPDGSKKLRRTIALVLMESSVDEGSYCRIGFLQSSVKNVWKAWAKPKSRRVITII